MEYPRSTPLALPAAVACAFVTALLTVVPNAADAAILTGSTAQFSGAAAFSAAGDVDFVSISAAPPGSDAGIPINSSGNTGSYVGYNVPNPPSLPVTFNYVAGFSDVSAGAPPASELIRLPSIAIGPGEAGPAVAGTRFVASSWTTSFVIVDGVTFLNAVAQGTIFDDGDGTSIGGIFSLSTQAFDPLVGAVNAFSGTLEATVIPLPAATWMLGSGLLAMFAVVRRQHRDRVARA